MNEKACRVEWFDDVNVESYRLAAREYGLDIEKTRDVADDAVEVRISGERDRVKDLISDMKSGDVRPMCSMRHLDEDQYAEWLESELAR